MTAAVVSSQVWAPAPSSDGRRPASSRSASRRCWGESGAKEREVAWATVLVTFAEASAVSISGMSETSRRWEARE